VKLRFPDFFIVGAQRSGTTSLHEYLKQHHQIFMCVRKEAHFFSQDRVRLDTDLVVKREVDYLSLFDCANGFACVGEASPSYLWHPEVPSRIRSKCANAKIIAILRDPVARAHSQYLMDLADGLPPTAFYDLILREYEHGDKVYGTGHLYVELGQYAQQIKRYFEVFGRERVLVLSFADLVSCPRDLVARIVAFLGLDPKPVGSIDTSRIYNQQKSPRTALVSLLLRLRLWRQLYRRIIPSELRYRLRDWLTVSSPKQVIDACAIEFLRSIYEPDVNELETVCGVAMPELRRTWL
jgi:hypothetical protein